MKKLDILLNPNVNLPNLIANLKNLEIIFFDFDLIKHPSPILRELIIQKYSLLYKDIFINALIKEPNLLFSTLTNRSAIDTKTHDRRILLDSFFDKKSFKKIITYLFVDLMELIKYTRLILLLNGGI